MKMFYMCPLCLYTLGSWSSFENCTIIDLCDETYRLCNPCKYHRGYSVQIKTVILVLKISVTHARSFLCFKYDKCDQWENTYPDMIGKTLNVISVYF